MLNTGIDSIFKGAGYYKISADNTTVTVLILTFIDFLDLVLLIEEQVNSPVVIKFLSKYEDCK